MLRSAVRALAEARQDVIGHFGKNGIGAEIGVWRGDFSAQILELARPSKLYLIDPWVRQMDDVHKNAVYGSESTHDIDVIYQSVVARFSEEEKLGQISILRTFSTDALQRFSDDYFDFIYIDGDHDYKSVRHDCFAAFDKVKQGGLICGDDYATDGWWGRGVVDAFHELLAERATLLKYVREDQIVVQKVVAEGKLPVARQ
jgi:hypothetical protein